MLYLKKQIYDIMEPKDLLNWGNVSRVLSGSRQTVRRESIPKKHQAAIDELEAAVGKWLSLHDDDYYKKRMQEICT